MAGSGEDTEFIAVCGFPVAGCLELHFPSEAVKVLASEDKIVRSAMHPELDVGSIRV